MDVLLAVETGKRSGDGIKTDDTHDVSGGSTGVVEVRTKGG